MNVLIVGSDNYTDINGVLITMQMKHEQADGEVVTFLIRPGTSVGDIVTTIALAGTEDGLEVEPWDGLWGKVDQGYAMFQEGNDGDDAEKIASDGRGCGVRVTGYYDYHSSPALSH